MKCVKIRSLTSKLKLSTMGACHEFPCSHKVAWWCLIWKSWHTHYLIQLIAVVMSSPCHLVCPTLPYIASTQDICIFLTAPQGLAKGYMSTFCLCLPGQAGTLHLFIQDCITWPPNSGGEVPCQELWLIDNWILVAAHCCELKVRWSVMRALLPGNWYSINSRLLLQVLIKLS